MAQAYSSLFVTGIQNKQNYVGGIYTQDKSKESDFGWKACAYVVIGNQQDACQTYFTPSNHTITPWKSYHALWLDSII